MILRWLRQSFPAMLSWKSPWYGWIDIGRAGFGIQPRSTTRYNRVVPTSYALGDWTP